MRIKICGITRPADAELAARLGADAIGLNFYEKSPRAIDVPRASEIVRVLPPFVEPVAVMVSPTADQLLETCSAAGLKTVQLHASDRSTLAPAIVGRSFRVLLAQGISDQASLEQLRNQVENWKKAGVHVAGVLVDASAKGLHGGTGQTAPWNLLAGFEPGVPVILAGGLTPDNVAEAIRIVRPYAVDVASGVESSPGIKDAEKLRRFIGEAREAGNEHHAPYLKEINP